MKKLAARDYEDLLQVGLCLDLTALISHHVLFSAQFQSLKSYYPRNTIKLSSHYFIVWRSGMLLRSFVCIRNLPCPTWKKQQLCLAMNFVDFAMLFARLSIWLSCQRKRLHEGEGQQVKRQRPRLTWHQLQCQWSRLRSLPPHHLHPSQPKQKSGVNDARSSTS